MTPLTLATKRLRVAETRVHSLAVGHRRTTATHTAYQTALTEFFAARDDLATLTIH